MAILTCKIYSVSAGKKNLHKTMKIQSYTQNLQCGALFWLMIIVHSLHTVKADHHLLAHKKQVSAISS